MAEIIKLTDVTYKYASGIVLKDVSFTISTGDYIGLVGHNGSGKTTLIKIILGLLTSASGQVKLFDQEISKFHDWRKIGYMPQNLTFINPIFPATVNEIISLGCLAGKKYPKTITATDQSKINQAMEKLQISNLKNRLIGNLSGGQQQRVFLARAIINNPDLLILDEPSNALDVETREQFFSTLKELNANYHTAIILITHDIGQIGNFASKLMYLDHQIVFFGSFSDFCKSNNMSKQFGISTQHLICHQHE